MIQKSGSLSKSIFAGIFFAIAALFAVLAVALYPLLFKNLKADRTSNTPKDLKQIATGFQIYLSEYDGAFPPKLDWQSDLNPYLKNESLFDLASSKSPRSYAMNSALSGRKLPEILDPSRTPLVFESSLTGRSRFGGKADLRRAGSEVGVAMADASARRMTIAEAVALDWSAVAKN